MLRTALSFLVALWVSAGASAAADPISDLTGYWTGTGSVKLSSGNTERVKCAVTYKVSEDGKQVRQTVRCASQDYTINAAADLKLNGEKVTGNWEEKTYSATGQITGKYTGTAFNLSIQGGTFSAVMNVALSNCKQSIDITPQGLDVTKVSIGLGKC